MSEPDQAARFPTTRWSRVALAADPAGDDARQALAELCGAYWYPVYAFVRRKGHDPEAALDLTQAYFARLLQRGTVAAADRDRGRFRSFLMAVCSDFLADRRDHDNARKRGGDRVVVSLDVAQAEGRFAREPAHELTPERIFDRNWAVTLLGRVLDLLRCEYNEAGRAETYEVLSVVLTEGPRAVPYATIAGRLGMSEGAVRVAVHRLRRRYGDLLRAEIAATVKDPAEVDDEIRALFAALRA
jgi:RNA polymerase sigma factor (sigma-70 family)